MSEMPFVRIRCQSVTGPVRDRPSGMAVAHGRQLVSNGAGGRLSVSLLCVAGFAENRSVFFRLKRNFAFLSALCAGGLVHFTWSEVSFGAALIEISHRIVSK